MGAEQAVAVDAAERLDPDQGLAMSRGSDSYGKKLSHNFTELAASSNTASTVVASRGKSAPAVGAAGCRACDSRAGSTLAHTASSTSRSASAIVSRLKKL